MTGATPLGEGGTDTRDVNQHGGPVTINPRNRGGRSRHCTPPLEQLRTPCLEQLRTPPLEQLCPPCLEQLWNRALKWPNPK